MGHAWGPVEATCGSVPVNGRHTPQPGWGARIHLRHRERSILGSIGHIFC